MNAEMMTELKNTYGEIKLFWLCITYCFCRPKLLLRIAVNSAGSYLVQLITILPIVLNFFSDSFCDPYMHCYLLSRLVCSEHCFKLFVPCEARLCDEMSF